MTVNHVRPYPRTSTLGVLCLQPTQPNRLPHLTPITGPRTTPSAGPAGTGTAAAPARPPPARPAPAPGPPPARAARPDPGIDSPPQTVPMTPQQYQQAVHAWAVLIASWWNDNPPDQNE